MFGSCERSDPLKDDSKKYDQAFKFPKVILIVSFGVSKKMNEENPKVSYEVGPYQLQMGLCITPISRMN